MRALWKAKLWDITAAFPLIAWFGVVAYACIAELTAVSDWRHAPFDYGTKLTTAIFATLLIFIFLVRHVPLVRQNDWRAIIAGFVGGFAPMSIVVLSRADISSSLMLLSTLLTFLGTVASIICILWLGRSFSILPQARALVTTGPYRFVRHPLYLSEIITLFGLMMQFKQPWASIAWLFSAVAQFPRMHFEEAILRISFPDYREYERRVPMVLPRADKQVDKSTTLDG